MSHHRTIAIDFDGVLHSYERGWADGSIYGTLTEGALPALLTLMRDHAVFVHTTRHPTPVARWIEHATAGAIECTTRMHPLLPSWWRWGYRTTFWNTSGVLLVTNRKIPAAVYIDDRALHHTTWPDTITELARRGLTTPETP